MILDLSRVCRRGDRRGRRPLLLKQLKKRSSWIAVFKLRNVSLWYLRQLYLDECDSHRVRLFIVDFNRAPKPKQHYDEFVMKRRGHTRIAVQFQGEAMWELLRFLPPNVRFIDALEAAIEQEAETRGVLLRHEDDPSKEVFFG